MRPNPKGARLDVAGTWGLVRAKSASVEIVRAGRGAGDLVHPSWIL